MASTAAGLQTLIDAIDDMILAKLTGADISKFKLGDESIEKYSISDLRLLRQGYVTELESLNSGTEYWDTFDQGVDTLTGEDSTVGIGDIED